MDIEYSIKEKDIIQFKKRRYVRDMVNKSIAKGEISRPDTCQLCKQTARVQAHHIDYGKPFAITWVCTACHGDCHRRGHPLNPSNNIQSPLPQVLEKCDMVTVAFSLPIKTYLAIKKESEEKNIPISLLLRNKSLQNFPVQENQLQFKFEEKKNEKPPEILQPRICSILQDVDRVLQSKLEIIPNLRKKGSQSMRRMEKKFRAVLC